MAETSNHSINLTGLSDGQHVIELNVTATTFFTPTEDHWGVHEYEMLVSEKISLTINSSSGNMTFRLDTISERVYPDNIPPVVSLLSANNKTYKTSNVPLDFTIDEPFSQIKYSLDRQENITIIGNTTLTGLSYGTHNVTVYARDEAGNIGASETKHFSIAEPEPEPFPTTLTIASIASVAVGGMVLLVYFKKYRS